MKKKINILFKLSFFLTLFILSSCATDEDNTDPTVSHTDPTDSAVGIAKDANISITFSEPMDATSVQGNYSNTTCSGSVQVSSDGFANCVQFSGGIASNENKTYTFAPAIDLTYGETYQIKVTTDATDEAGNALSSEYLSTTGFTPGLYKVEYTEPVMGAKEGKTVFDIKVTDNDTDSAASGLDITILPVMHMASMNHTTPVDTIVDNSDGTYTCTLYYLMATMGDQYWELTVTASDGVDTTVATFTPTVGMAMGDTPKVVLKGVTDKILNMATPEPRKYYLFHDGLSGTSGNHSFGVFISTRESMMNHPAVYVGQTLKDEMLAIWNVVAMTVEVSTDAGLNYTPMNGDGTGHWSISGLTGLIDGTEGTIQIKLSVDDGTTDEQKLSMAGADFLTYTVTP